LKKERQKHDYTSELELKSLLIRIKNKKFNTGFQERKNANINKYIRLHTKLNNGKHDDNQKKNKVKKAVYNNVVKLSELTTVDEYSYERFGEIILLMIKKILTKSQFSGYTYRDEFYSDAVHKILKYLHNFDHNLISERSGLPVNAFAYISQIIHNSVLYIINTKKQEQQRLKNNIAFNIETLNHDLSIKSEISNEGTYFPHEHTDHIVHKIDIEEVTSLVQKIKELTENQKDDYYFITYPSDYRISMEEYNELRDILKGNISITRRKND
jgi:hypothetical protein